MNIETRCGLLCTVCEFKDPCKCGERLAANGKPFYGECPVAVCCRDKGFLHCGECPDIQRGLSCNPEHEDTPHGARIKQCKSGMPKT